MESHERVLSIDAPRGLLTFFEGVGGACRAEGAGARRTGGQFGVQLLKGSHRTAGNGLGLAH